MKLLFLCTGNSCRSQMAEGWCRALLGGGSGHAIDACSAGTAPKGLDPRAVAVMAEVGIDISGYRSKHLDEFRHGGVDVVVTVCDGAHEACPVLPGARQTLHRSFDDPPRLVQGMTDEDDILVAYRRVRDEIRRFVAEELCRAVGAIVG